jgi:hypothetical protein
MVGELGEGWCESWARDGGGERYGGRGGWERWVGEVGGRGGWERWVREGVYARRCVAA